MMGRRMHYLERNRVFPVKAGVPPPFFFFFQSLMSGNICQQACHLKCFCRKTMFNETQGLLEVRFLFILVLAGSIWVFSVFVASFLISEPFNLKIYDNSCQRWGLGGLSEDGEQFWNHQVEEQSLLHPASQEDAEKMNPDSVFSSFTLMLVLPIGYVKSDTRRQGGLNDQVYRNHPSRAQSRAERDRD